MGNKRNGRAKKEYRQATARMRQSFRGFKTSQEQLTRLEQRPGQSKKERTRLVFDIMTNPDIDDADKVLASLTFDQEFFS